MDVLQASRVKATAQALLKSILKDLVSADQKDAEGIFSQPAPVGLKGYQELCPRPMSLQEIRCCSETSTASALHGMACCLAVACSATTDAICAADERWTKTSTLSMPMA